MLWPTVKRSHNSENMKTISLTRGKIALVDDADFDWLSSFKWYARPARNTWYAYTHEYRNGIRRNVSMHVMLMRPAVPLETDHWNHDGLDNQRGNLRIVTKSINAKNRIKNRQGFWYSVHYYSQRMKWRLVVCGKYAGLYETKAAALSVVTPQ